jgi:hypothetical protein
MIKILIRLLQRFLTKQLFIFSKKSVFRLKQYFQLTLLGTAILLLTSCGPKNLEDYKEEGKGVTRSLIQELRHIRNRDELLAAHHLLQKRFDQLVSIIIAAREFQHKYPDWETHELSLLDHELSDKLRVELNRLYQIEGGRQIIEKYQEMALNRLDACEKKLNHAKHEK